jgi:hypothetical protein
LAGFNIDSTRWSGSLKHDLTLTFAVELEVFFDFNVLSVEREEFMKMFKSRLTEETKRVQDKYPEEEWEVVKLDLGLWPAGRFSGAKVSTLAAFALSPCRTKCPMLTGV